MKVTRTALLFVLFVMVLSQIIVPRHESHKRLFTTETMLFTPTICDLGIADIISTSGSLRQTTI